MIKKKFIFLIFIVSIILSLIITYPIMYNIFEYKSNEKKISKLNKELNSLTNEYEILISSIRESELILYDLKEYENNKNELLNEIENNKKEYTHLCNEIDVLNKKIKVQESINNNIKKNVK